MKVQQARTSPAPSAHNVLGKGHGPIRHEATVAQGSRLNNRLDHVEGVGCQPAVSEPTQAQQRAFLCSSNLDAHRDRCCLIRRAGDSKYRHAHPSTHAQAHTHTNDDPHMTGVPATNIPDHARQAPRHQFLKHCVVPAVQGTAPTGAHVLQHHLATPNEERERQATSETTRKCGCKGGGGDNGTPRKGTPTA